MEFAFELMEVMMSSKTQYQYIYKFSSVLAFFILGVNIHIIKKAGWSVIHEKLIFGSLFR